MKSLIKDALILTAITLVAGLCLGLVYEITKEPIEKAQEQATQDSYRAVFAEADSFDELDGFDAAEASAYVAAAGYTDDDIENIVVAQNSDGEVLGYVITVTSHAGYGGDITFSVGITLDGILNGYSITDISETAGLGMKAKESKFMSQFEGISAQILEVTKTGATDETEIDAISGATITSKAVTYGVDAAITYFNYIAGGDE